MDKYKFFASLSNRWNYHNDENYALLKLLTISIFYNHVFNKISLMIYAATINKGGRN